MSGNLLNKGKTKLFENSFSIAASGGIGPTTPTTFTTGSVIFAQGGFLAEDNTNFFWDDTNNLLSIGNASRVGQRLVRFGQDTALIDIGSLVGATSSGAIYINQVTPSATNATLRGDNSGNVSLNSSGANSVVDITNGTNVLARFTQWQSIFTPQVRNTAAMTAFTITNSANTGQTLSTEIPSVLVTTGTRQWATGAITTQREFLVTAPTYSFVGASTITTASTFTVADAPTAGTNATITTKYAIWAQAGRIKGSGGIDAGFGSSVGYYINTNTFAEQISTTFVIGAGLGQTQFTPIALSGGALTVFTFTLPNSTTQTASTEALGIDFVSGTIQHATGALTTQRNYYFRSRTHTFVGASTLAEAYNVYIEAPTAGTNATVTNNFALGLTNGTYTIKIGQLTGTAGQPAIYLNQATPSSNNYSITADSATTVVNGNVSLTLNIFGTTRLLLTGVTASGANNFMTWTQPATTNQTLSTEINGFKFLGSSRQWATGAITTQRETYFSTTTYTAVGASVITKAYGMYIEQPTASTNITISSNFALGLDGNIDLVGGNRSIFGSNAVTIQCSSGSNILLNSGSSTGQQLLIAGQGTNRMQIMTGTPTSGATGFVIFTPPTYTGQTASTEVNGYLYNSYSKTWAAGAITTQREQYMSTVTYAFASASTITNAYGLYVDAPTAGSNATITNNYALGTLGDVRFIVGTSTEGMKIMGAVGATTSPSLYIEQSTPSGTNYALRGTASDTILNATTNLYLRIGNTIISTITSGLFTMGAARLVEKQGAAVASANNLVLGSDGNFFEITGTTQINLLSNLSYQDGAMVTLGFTSTPTVKHGQATSTTNITILLAGAADFVASANDMLTLRLCTIGGTQAWREVARTAI